MTDFAQTKNDFDQRLSDKIDKKLDNLNTAIPAKIVNFSNGFADVKPSVSVIINKQEVELPIIYEVPVQFPQSNDLYITFPVKSGDPCLLIFCQSDLSRWYSEGHISLTHTDRKFNINDAICIMGVNNQTNVIEDINPNNIEIRNKDATTKIEVADDGIEFHTDSEELINLLIESIQLFIDHAHPADNTPSNNVPDAVLLQLRLRKFLIN